MPRVPRPIRLARAMATNQIARHAPSLYVRLTRQTGRGAASAETPSGIAGYFVRCVDDYLSMLGVARDNAAAYLAGKTTLEYGPGDLPGVAVLLVALGAQKVYCVDRFPLYALSAKNVGVLRALRGSLAAPEQQRFDECFVQPGVPESGFRDDRIHYLIRPSGLSGLRDRIDLAISRAVLEHVDDLPALFADMTAAMRAGASAAHQVDLRSHGLHRSNPLDFLEMSSRLWALLYSHKGVPNRWRVDVYRSIVASLPVTVLRLETTARADPRDVAAVRPGLADEFRGVSDDDLACLGFWIVFRKNVT